MIKFGLIGNGRISQRHKEAIKHVGGDLVWIADPIFDGTGPTFHNGSDTPAQFTRIPDMVMESMDYIVICSPTSFHRQHTQEVLKYGCKVICEKPLCLPWEPLIDDDRINIVLQLRWIKDLPKKADLVRAVMVRNEEFFKSWHGDPRLAGGNIYEFFIHYIDLAILLGADFEGEVLPSGKQVREIHGHYDSIGYPEGGSKYRIDIMSIDMQDLYNRMYDDILIGKGVKPKDIFYLTWVLNQESARHGYRYGGINNRIKIGKELL